MNLSDLRVKIRAFFNDRLSVVTMYLIFAVITISSIFITIGNMDNKSLLEEEYVPAKIAGVYSIDNGITFRPFEDYSELDIDGVDRMIVRGRLMKGLNEHEKLYIFMNYINATIYINDAIVYVSDSDSEYGWDALENIEISSNDIMTFELETMRPVRKSVAFVSFFKEMNKSSKAALLFHQLKHYSWFILGDVIIMVLGCLMIINGAETIYSVNENNYGLVSCGIATFLGAFTCFINPKYITLIFSEFEYVEYVDRILETFTVLFIFVYFRRFLKREDLQKKATVLVVFSYIAMSVFLLWTSIGYPAGSLPITILIAGGVVICIHYIWFFVKDSIGIGNRMELVALGAALYLVASTCGEMLYYLYYGVFQIHALEIGLLVFALVQFWFIFGKMSQARKEALRLKEIENELTKAQVNSMISQIQPHFLYNALSTIRALCARDPQRAREAIDLLSKYLRANMESLSTKECISIEKELEHVECYLSIEKYRFGDKLNVEYDIQSTDFKVPCMAVQTLAENAVKHGLLARPDGGTLKISTSESEYCYVVNIADDGVGFDRTDGIKENRIHVGIENTRKRLAAMCKGTLSIGSIAGKGTTVTICIPKNSI